MTNNTSLTYDDLLKTNESVKAMDIPKMVCGTAVSLEKLGIQNKPSGDSGLHGVPVCIAEWMPKNFIAVETNEKYQFYNVDNGVSFEIPKLTLYTLDVNRDKDYYNGR